MRSSVIHFRLRQNLTKDLRRSSFFCRCPFAVLPRGVETVHIRDRELIEHEIPSGLAIGSQLLDEVWYLESVEASIPRF